MVRGWGKSSEGGYWIVDSMVRGWGWSVLSYGYIASSEGGEYDQCYPMVKELDQRVGNMYRARLRSWV